MRVRRETRVIDVSHRKKVTMRHCVPLCKYCNISSWRRPLSKGREDGEGGGGRDKREKEKDFASDIFASARPIKLQITRMFNRFISRRVDEMKQRRRNRFFMKSILAKRSPAPIIY